MTLNMTPRKSVDLPLGDGDPLINGTTIEIHRIAALLDGGATVEEVMYDYPSLSSEQIEDARDYARLHPEHEHAYPGQSLKAFFRSGALRHMKDALEEADADE